MFREPTRSLLLVLVAVGAVLGSAYAAVLLVDESADVALQPVWGWPSVVASGVGLIAVVMLTYPQRIAHISPGWRRWLLRLRLLTAVVLVLAMLRPAVELRKTDDADAVLYIVTDASGSMGTKDGPGGVTRRQAVLDTIAASEERLAAIGENVTIRWFDFASDLAPVERPEEAADGVESALGKVFETVLREARGERVVGVVLMSDGAQRARPENDADPRAVARLLAEEQIPVFTVPYGGTGLTGSAFDLAVEDLQVDPLAFEKKAVPVTARIRAIGAQGRELIVRLRVEDRTGKSPGQSGEMVVPQAVRNARPSARVTSRRESDVIDVDLSYVPDRPGEFKVALEVVPLDGELRTANNTESTIITVQKGGINVAYFDTYRPEQKWIRLVNGSEKIQLDFQVVRSGKLANRGQIDAEMFEPGRYDAYIIGDVPAEAFGEKLLNELAARVREGAGLMMTGGFHSFGPGGYAGTPLAPLLPVRMDRADVQPGGAIDASLHVQEPMQMLPRRDSLRHYLMRIDAASQNEDAWKSLPKLEHANRLRVKRDGLAVVLAESEDAQPLLVAQEIGQARILAFAGDSTFLWVLDGKETLHQRFWRQVILWLSRKESDQGEGVWAHVDPRNVTPNQAVEVTMGANSPDDKPVADAEFTAEVVGPDGETQKLAPAANEEQTTARFDGTSAPGDYWVRVSARSPTVELPFAAWTRFVVDARDLELDNPAADPALLEEIAALTGGTSLPPEQFGSFLERKRDGDGFVLRDVTNLRRITLWDNWPFLLVFVSLLTLEWFLRKRRGMV